MKPEISESVFFISTILAAIGLSYIIYSRNNENRNSRLFLLTLLLTIGYMISHGFHFLIMKASDVTFLDRSCHSFLLLIMVALTFFALNFPTERKLRKFEVLLLLLPSIAILGLLWGGYLVKESHMHAMHFQPHFTKLYPIFLLWYLFLLTFSSYILIRKYISETTYKTKMQILVFFIGLIITNLTSFLFGMAIPWVLGFYYLVEISPLSFLSGVIMFTSIAIGKFDMFPKELNKVRNFSINKKVILVALILVPIIIMLVQIPLGKLILGIHEDTWISYFLISLIGGLTVSIVMAILINVIISFPIKELKSKALEIKKGDYEVSVNIVSNDELGELGEAFNDMASTLNSNANELKRKEQRISTLLNAFEKSAAAIAVIDTDYKLIEANNKFCDLIEQNILNIEGKSIFDLQVNKSYFSDFEKIKKVIYDKTSIDDEFLFCSSSGEKYLFISISPVYSSQGVFNGFLFVEVDITERKNLENKLLQTEKLAALGKMSAILAHEIKTPLTSIKMNADILNETLNLSDEDSQSFQIIQKEIKRLTNLVKDVLQFSRQMDIVIDKINLYNIAEDTINQLQPKIRQKNIIINNSIQSFDIKADGEKLKQVFLNLLENSIEAVGENGKVELVSVISNNTVLLQIKDNGTGIENGEKIFDPFFTTKASGTGLGLSVSQKIIEQHGGTIRLLSSKPGNTIFEIIIPNKV